MAINILIGVSKSCCLQPSLLRYPRLKCSIFLLRSCQSETSSLEKVIPNHPPSMFPWLIKDLQTAIPNPSNHVNQIESNKFIGLFLNSNSLCHQSEVEVEPSDHETLPWPLPGPERQSRAHTKGMPRASLALLGWIAGDCLVKAVAWGKNQHALKCYCSLSSSSNSQSLDMENGMCKCYRILCTINERLSLSYTKTIFPATRDKVTVVFIYQTKKQAHDSTCVVDTKPLSLVESNPLFPLSIPTKIWWHRRKLWSTKGSEKESAVGRRRTRHFRVILKGLTCVMCHVFG